VKFASRTRGPAPTVGFMEITVCRAADVALLDRYMSSPGATSFHARRFERQQAGQSTYLIAWREGRPVGHTELRWIGCDAPEVTVGCPGIGGLAVWPEELRSRGIGTELVRAAEESARERGLPLVGIGVGRDNPRAAALYARLGYRPVVDYLPALIVVLLAMAFLLGGARESARANTVMVCVKIAALVLFCAIGIQGFRSGNYEHFMPLGMAGVSAAGATLFFSYIGFDAASTAGEEAKNAQRDLPRAIMLSLVIVTALYVLVAAVAVGAKPWQRFNDSEAALALIMREVTGRTFWGTLLAACAVIAIASVVLTVLYGQTRVLFAMSRDGLVPKVFAKVHPKTGAPRANTVIVSLFCGVLAAAIPLGQLADATSIGTLFAFALVNIAVVVLRRTRPAMNRTFRVPLSPLLPALGLAFCVWMMGSLSAVTWTVFGVWMAVGLVFYFGYGYRRSRLAPSES
jgi:amino acid transporter